MSPTLNQKHRNCHQQAIIVTTDSNSHRNCHQNYRNCHHFSSDKTETIIEATDEDDETSIINFDAQKYSNIKLVKESSKQIVKKREKKHGKKKSKKHRWS